MIKGPIGIGVDPHDLSIVGHFARGGIVVKAFIAGVMNDGHTVHGIAADIGVATLGRKGQGNQ
jgi:hypothetical protein